MTKQESPFFVGQHGDRVDITDILSDHAPVDHEAVKKK